MVDPVSTPSPTLEEIITSACAWLDWPHDNYGQAVLAALREAGYSTVRLEQVGWRQVFNGRGPNLWPIEHVPAFGEVVPVFRLVEE